MILVKLYYNLDRVMEIQILNRELVLSLFLCRSCNRKTKSTSIFFFLLFPLSEQKHGHSHTLQSFNLLNPLSPLFSFQLQWPQHWSAGRAAPPATRTTHSSPAIPHNPESLLLRLLPLPLSSIRSSSNSRATSLRLSPPSETPSTLSMTLPNPTRLATLCGPPSCAISATSIPGPISPRSLSATFAGTMTPCLSGSDPNLSLRRLGLMGLLMNANVKSEDSVALVFWVWLRSLSSMTFLENAFS